MSQWSKSALRKRIAFYERNLKLQQLATADEIEAVASRFRGRPTKDELWQWFAELRSLARRNEWKSAEGSGRVTADELDAALEALEGRGEYVQLASVKLVVRIVPASYDRINLIEHLEWTALRLEAAEALIRRKIDAGDDAELPGYDVDICPECERPRRPAALDELLARIQAEITHNRGLIYAQVTAPGPSPAPAAEGVTWASKLTPIEHVALVQAYHRVNLDLLRRLPKPMSRDGERELPTHWSFLFAQLEARTDKQIPADRFMRDRSLAAIVAAVSLEEREHESSRKKAEERQRAEAGARKAARRAR